MFCRMLLRVAVEVFHSRLYRVINIYEPPARISISSAVWFRRLEYARFKVCYQAGDMTVELCTL